MAKKQIFEKWVVLVRRTDGLSFEKLEKEDEVELTQAEADELNEQSHQNGIRYYAQG